MKKTFYTFLIAGLALSTSMRAQDAPSRPLKDPTTDPSIEPTPLPRSNISPTPEPATPRPKPTPRATPARPSPTPEPSQPAPSATPEQTPSKKVTKVVAKPELTPPPAAPKHKSDVTPTAKAEARPTPGNAPRSRKDERAVAAKLKDLEKEWEASFNNPAVIEKSLADDFIGTSPGGKVMTKKDLLREAKEDTSPPPKTIARDLDVHFYGPDIAVVTGASRQIDKNRAGQNVEHNYRFTDTWVERDGIWKCVASQSILLPRQ